MARKRFSDEDILKLLRQIEVDLSSGSNIETACRSVGISTATYYNWRRRYGGMGRSQLSESERRTPCVRVRRERTWRKRTGA